MKRENNREQLAGQEGGWFRESLTGEQDKERPGGQGTVCMGRPGEEGAVRAVSLKSSEPGRLKQDRSSEG